MKKGDEPAFPISIDTGDRVKGFYGLTKRQWLAGMAMQGMLANERQVSFFETTGNAAKAVAELSFEIADAMIAFEEKEAGERP